MEANRIKKRDSGTYFRHSERQVNFSKKHNLVSFVFYLSAGKIPSWQELVTSWQETLGFGEKKTA